MELARSVPALTLLMEVERKVLMLGLVAAPPVEPLLLPPPLLPPLLPPPPPLLLLPRSLSPP